MKRLVLLASIALLTVACSGTTSFSGADASGTLAPTAMPAAKTQMPPASEPPAAKTAAPTQFIPTPAPTPAGIPVVAVGEATLIDCDNAPCLNITVSNVSQATKFSKTGWTERPDVGYVFLSAKITYQASVSGVDYNPFDWEISTNGDTSDPPCATGVSCIGGVPIVIAGPAPTLHSGTLSAGKTVSGYIVWEVPVTGEVRIAYMGNGSYEEPLFEIVLRAK